ncbi:hypothetical protein [Caudoviricetes sp.]|nr:hypothetical protein [Caudoviricetes sp.]
MHEDNQSSHDDNLDDIPASCEPTFRLAISADYEAICVEPRFTLEQRIWLLVLWQALQDIKAGKQPHANRGVLAQTLRAVRWMWLTEKPKIGSFSWICDLLEIEPEPIKEWVRDIVEKIRKD